MTELSPAVRIARDLIRCPSVTPEEGGALVSLQTLLEAVGFRVDRVTFSDADTPDVENLFATIGSGKPHFVFDPPPRRHSPRRSRMSICTMMDAVPLDTLASIPMSVNSGNSSGIVNVSV